MARIEPAVVSVASPASMTDRYHADPWYLADNHCYYHFERNRGPLPTPSFRFVCRSGTVNARQA
jgi:hypothetical protein